MGTDQDFAATIADLAGTLYLAGSQHIPQLVVAAAKDLTPGCPEATMCLLDRHGGMVPAATTGEPAAQADRIWHATGDGPCPATIRKGTVHQLRDLRHDEVSPAVSLRVAQETGLRCALSLPLVAGTEVLGALTMVTRTPHELGPRAVIVGSVLARHSAVALAGARAQERNQELSEALQTNRLIGMALGIVMARHRVTPQQAFDILRRCSRHRHVKIRELSAEIVETGEVPGDGQCAGSKRT